MSTTVIETWGNNTTDTYTGLYDTHINSGGANSNYCTTSDIIVGYNQYYRILFKFSLLNQLLYSDTIQDARLRLYCTSTYTAGVKSLYTYRVFKPWVFDEVTYNRYKYNVLWNGSGCGNASDVGVDDGTADRKSTAEYLLDTQSAGSWAEIDITNLIKKWVNKKLKNTVC